MSDTAEILVRLEVSIARMEGKIEATNQKVDGVNERLDNLNGRTRSTENAIAAINAVMDERRRRANPDQPSGRLSRVRALGGIGIGLGALVRWLMSSGGK